MGLFDKKEITPEVKEQVITGKYRISITTTSETYNFQSGQPLDHCREEVSKIIKNQCFIDGLLYVPYPQIKRIEILEVRA